MAMSTSESGRLARVTSPDEISSGGGLAASARNLAFTVLPILVIMVGWEVAVRLSNMPDAILPPLSKIFVAIWTMGYDGTLWVDIGSTLSRLFESALIGIVVGTVIGVMMGYFKIWERMLVAPMNFLLAIPGTAMFPLSMIWFGLTEWAIISILIYEVTITVMLNTWTGVKTVDMSLIRAGRAFGVRLAVVVTDTAGRAWREGLTDIAIGAAGLRVLDDLRGTRDTFGRVLEATVAAVADEVASAAELVKGKTSGRPVAVVRGVGHLVTDDHGPGARALLRAPEQDMFRLGTAEAFEAGRRSVRGTAPTGPDGLEGSPA